MLPLVSVVITTKNEEKNIAACLESILQQTYPRDRIEIIVVDNYSTDKTKEIVSVIASSAKQSIQFFDKGPERSAQRNFGVEKSSGEYFLYLDADMILSPDVIKECVEKFENRQLVGLYIPEIIMGESFWCKVRRFERSFYNGTVIDCVRFIRRETFLKVKGFDETLTGPEDWDFDKKIRQVGKVALIKSPVHHNESQFNLRKYVNKKSYYAKSFNTYIAKWGKDDLDIKKQFGFCYRFLYVFTKNDQWYRLILHPILALGVLSLKALTGFLFIKKRTF